VERSRRVQEQVGEAKKGVCHAGSMDANLMRDEAAELRLERNFPSKRFAIEKISRRSKEGGHAGGVWGRAHGVQQRRAGPGRGLLPGRAHSSGLRGIDLSLAGPFVRYD
jgi:hypothetical protein